MARGGRQRLLTSDPEGVVPRYLPLRVDPVAGTYQADAGNVVFTELRPVSARNPLAPVLNQPAMPLPPRYQTATGGGYLPLLPDAAFQPTYPV